MGNLSAGYNVLSMTPWVIREWRCLIVGVAASVLVGGCPRHHGDGDDADVDGSIPLDGDRPECLLAEGVRTPKPGCPDCPAGENLLYAEETELLICSGSTDHPLRSSIVLDGMCHGQDVMLDARDPLDQPGCVSPAVCRWWHEGDLSDPLRCTYADTTQMVTGEIPPLEPARCEAVRSRGGCGIDCDCLSEDDVCYGISEVHPLGACAHYAAICSTDRGCPEVNEQCLRPTALPAFDEAFWVMEPGDDRVRGRCVPTEACALVMDQDPEWYECL